MSDRGRFDPHTLAAVGADLEAAAAPADLNRELWRLLVIALSGFVRDARRLLGMRRGEKCPKCGHTY